MNRKTSWRTPTSACFIRRRAWCRKRRRPAPRRGAWTGSDNSRKARSRGAMKLKDKVVLITGAGSGLGREMGLTFAREGAKVGVNDIRPESAQNVVTEIERAGGKARAFVADVTSSAAVGKMFATHLDSTFYCTREALKLLIPKQSGRIINMGSVAGTTGLAFASDYCAAKGGIIAFTKSVAREVVMMGILVMCIAPGFIDTPMTAIIEGEFRKQLEAMTPMGRFGEPSDIAAAALFLACEDSKFMVGQVLSPNGGYVI